MCIAQIILSCQGLFGRGLRTRILGNAVQSVLFTVVWRGLAERRNQKQDVQTNSDKVNRDEFDDAALTSVKGDDDLDVVPMEEERN